MKQCPHCQALNASNSQYCEQCGTLLEAAIPYDATISSAYSERKEYPAQSAGSIPPLPYNDYTDPSAYNRPTPSSLQNQYERFSPPAPVYPSSVYPPYGYANISAPQPGRSAGGIISSIIFYLIGISIASFGVAAALMYSTSNNVIIGASFLIALLIGLIILIPALIIYKTPRFKWWHRLLWTLGSIIGSIIIVISIQAMITLQAGSLYQNSTNPLAYLNLGVCCFISGTIIAITALR